MTRQRLSALALACTAVLPGVASPDATAAGGPMAGAPAPRTGAYKIARHGPHAIRARCLEGGNVLVPTHEKSTAARRDRDIRAACKTVDYTK